MINQGSGKLADVIVSLMELTAKDEYAPARLVSVRINACTKIVVVEEHIEYVFQFTHVMFEARANRESYGGHVQNRSHSIFFHPHLLKRVWGFFL